MHRIDLPGGGWADIAEPDELSNRNRKLVRRYAFPAYEIRDHFPAPGPALDPGGPPAATALDIAAGDMDIVSDMQAAFIVAYTVAWSFGDLPTMDTVDDLPGPVFDALAEATAAQGDGSVDMSVDGAINPASPTVPSPV